MTGLREHLQTCARAVTGKLFPGRHREQILLCSQSSQHAEPLSLPRKRFSVLWWHRVIRCRLLVRRSYLQALFRGKGHPLQNDPQIDGLLSNPFRMVNKQNHGLAACHHRGICRGRVYARRVLLPAMPRDETEADQLAPPHLDGPHHRTAIRETSLCGVRQSASLRQAVATGSGEAAGA